MKLLQKELISGPLVNADETPVQVLDEPGRSNTTNSSMWVFRGTPRKEAVLYRYSPTRSSDDPQEILLQGYRGYLQTDAFFAYDGLGRQVRLVGCFAATCASSSRSSPKLKRSKTTKPFYRKGLPEQLALVLPYVHLPERLLC
jgi:transposase